MSVVVVTAAILAVAMLRSPTLPTLSGMDERLAALARDLRVLALDALRRLPGEPLLHGKRVLAEHAEEDTRLAAALEAAGAAATPDGESAAPGVTDRPAACRAAAATARALADEAEGAALEALVAVALALDRHADELPAPRVPLPATGRDPWVVRAPGAPPDDLEDAIAAAEDAARAGDPGAAADHLRHAAELDRARAEAGDPWGLRPVPERPRRAGG